MNLNEGVQYFVNRLEWRQWLKKYHKLKSEVWLLYPKKATGKPRISYNDAVEEALCFGWIDSVNKKYDEQHNIQRFTPRRRSSGYSQANVERLRWLYKKDMIQPDLKAEIQPILEQEFLFPEDIIRTLKADLHVWKNFQIFSLPYRRIRIAYIESARKRPEEFEKRLSNFIEKTRAGKRIKGFGGIEKYY